MERRAQKKKKRGDDSRQRDITGKREKKEGEAVRMCAERNGSK